MSELIKSIVKDVVFEMIQESSFNFFVDMSHLDKLLRENATITDDDRKKEIRIKLKNEHITESERDKLYSELKKLE
jgi:hypothetical protein